MFGLTKLILVWNVTGTAIDLSARNVRHILLDAASVTSHAQSLSAVALNVKGQCENAVVMR